VTVTVPFADLAAPFVDEELRMMVARNLAADRGVTLFEMVP
jgi:hypothetical protein